MAILTDTKARNIKPEDKVLRGSVGKGKLTDRDRVNW